MSQEMIEEQLRIEQQCRDSGIDRFLAATRDRQDGGREDLTGYGTRVMKRVIDPLRDAIDAAMADFSKGRAGNRSKFFKYLRNFPTDVIAYLTAKTVVQNLVTGSNMTLTARAISSAIQDEMLLASFDKEMPGLYHHLRSTYASNGQDHRMTVLRRSYREHSQDPDRRWSVGDATHVGVALLHLLIESTGIVEKALEGKPAGRGHGGKTPRKDTYILRATPKLLDVITSVQAADALARPPLLPMVVPPRPWTDAFDGGYLGLEARGHSLLRAPMRTVEEFNARRCLMPAVYAAVNYAQSVAWKINGEVLEVASALWESRQAVAGLVSGDPIPVPPFPADLAQAVKPKTKEEKAAWKASLSPDSRETFRLWKLAARDVHTHNATSQGRRIASGQALAVARQFARYGAIWFPHSYDFRGRLYAIPPGLSPQGSDLSKGLLRFVEGKRVGDSTGPRWLAIHGANTWGNDKVSFTDRIEWVKANEASILACAENPLGDLWWSEADSPFCFLAFCFEWAGYRRDGADHITHIPVALDGSCSGLQHYSAALLDPVGGVAVNLTPQDKPADVYSEVAKRATAMLQLKADLGGDDAAVAGRLIALGIDRAATKRPTMTLPYGSTRMSCSDHIEEWLFNKVATIPGARERFGSDLSAAAKLLSSAVWDAIGDTVVAPRVVMAWLRQVAGAATKEELPLTWVAPDGFLVNQQNWELGDRRIKTRMGDNLVYLKASDETDRLDKAKQRNSFPPNWVHSMDATHLRMVAVGAPKNGIDSLALIHDSFGTLAPDCDVLGALLRETMIDLYSVDRLEELRDQLCAYLPDEAKVPNSPARGSLDLGALRDAQFAFA
jgi:DNA-directed RNA polymerase